MSVFKPEPFSSDVNRLFNTLFSGAEDRPERWSPAMDLVEADDHFVLKADLPGLGEDDISIEIQDNTLTVSGERRSEHEAHERGWYRVERSFGRFSRSLTLPEGVNPEAVSASFDRGVLSIRIPKPEERKPRRVTIAASGQRVEHPPVEGSVSEQPAGAPPGGGESTGPPTTGPGIAPSAPPVEGESGGQGGPGQGQHAPVAGGEHEEEEAGGAETEAQKGAEPGGGSPETTQAGPAQQGGTSAPAAQHPAQHGAPTTDPEDHSALDRTEGGVMGDSTTRGTPAMGTPDETSATTPGEGALEARFTGQGGLERDQSIAQSEVTRDEIGDEPTEGEQRRVERGYDDEGADGEVGSLEEKAGLPPDVPDGAVPETPEEHPDPGEHPPSQGPG